MHSTLHVFLGARNESFDSAFVTSSVNSSTTDFATDDLNLDGHNELVALCSKSGVAEHASQYRLLSKGVIATSGDRTG